MDYIVDIGGTRAFSDIYNKPCDCTYCENYYQAFSTTYPEVAMILQEFGLCIERPIEVIEYYRNSTKDKRLYESYYSVKGELCRDKIEIYSKDAIVILFKPDTDAPIYKNTGMEMPYFIVEVSNIHLPWILPELPPD